ncbi:MAG: hypothetical protein JSW26_22045, partial [Desulfobacterales bacterium]
FQISSTKFQTNSKLQYLMTKTFNTVVSQRILKSGLAVTALLGKTVDGHLYGLRRARSSLILNLDHWNLFVIWFLELEICMILILSQDQTVAASVTTGDGRCCVSARINNPLNGQHGHIIMSGCNINEAEQVGLDALQ